MLLVLERGLIYRISYPTLEGIGIKHDPTYVAFFVPHLIFVNLPVWDPLIIAYLAVAAAVIATITFLVLKRCPKNSVPPESLRQ